jgi:hypothetical protein
LSLRSAGGPGGGPWPQGGLGSRGRRLGGENSCLRSQTVTVTMTVTVRWVDRTDGGLGHGPKPPTPMASDIIPGLSHTYGLPYMYGLFHTADLVLIR